MRFKGQTTLVMMMKAVPVILVLQGWLIGALLGSSDFMQWGGFRQLNCCALVFENVQHYFYKTI